MKKVTLDLDLDLDQQPKRHLADGDDRDGAGLPDVRSRYTSDIWSPFAPTGDKEEPLHNRTILLTSSSGLELRPAGSTTGEGGREPVPNLSAPPPSAPLTSTTPKGHLTATSTISGAGAGVSSPVGGNSGGNSTALWPGLSEHLRNALALRRCSLRTSEDSADESAEDSGYELEAEGAEGDGRRSDAKAEKTGKRGPGAGRGSGGVGGAGRGTGAGKGGTPTPTSSGRSSTRMHEVDSNAHNYAATTSYRRGGTGSDATMPGSPAMLPGSTSGHPSFSSSSSSYPYGTSHGNVGAMSAAMASGAGLGMSAGMNMGGLSMGMMNTNYPGHPMMGGVGVMEGMNNTTAQNNNVNTAMLQHANSINMMNALHAGYGYGYPVGFHGTEHSEMMGTGTGVAGLGGPSNLSPLAMVNETASAMMMSSYGHPQNPLAMSAGMGGVVYPPPRWTAAHLMPLLASVPPNMVMVWDNVNGVPVIIPSPPSTDGSAPGSTTSPYAYNVPYMSPYVSTSMSMYSHAQGQQQQQQQPPPPPPPPQQQQQQGEEQVQQNQQDSAPTATSGPGSKRVNPRGTYATAVAGRKDVVGGAETTTTQRKAKGTVAKTATTTTPGTKSTKPLPPSRTTGAGGRMRDVDGFSTVDDGGDGGAGGAGSGWIFGASGRGGQGVIRGRGAGSGDRSRVMDPHTHRSTAGGGKHPSSPSSTKSRRCDVKKEREKEKLATGWDQASMDTRRPNHPTTTTGHPTMRGGPHRNLVVLGPRVSSFTSSHPGPGAVPTRTGPSTKATTTLPLPPGRGAIEKLGVVGTLMRNGELRLKHGGYAAMREGHLTAQGLGDTPVVHRTRPTSFKREIHRQKAIELESRFVEIWPVLREAEHDCVRLHALLDAARQRGTANVVRRLKDVSDQLQRWGVFTALKVAPFHLVVNLVYEGPALGADLQAVAQVSQVLGATAEGVLEDLIGSTLQDIENQAWQPARSLCARVEAFLAQTRTFIDESGRRRLEDEMRRMREVVEGEERVKRQDARAVRLAHGTNKNKRGNNRGGGKGEGEGVGADISTTAGPPKNAGDLGSVEMNHIHHRTTSRSGSGTGPDAGVVRTHATPHSTSATVELHDHAEQDHHDEVGNGHVRIPLAKSSRRSISISDSDPSGAAVAVSMTHPRKYVSSLPHPRDMADEDESGRDLQHLQHVRTGASLRSSRHLASSNRTVSGTPHDSVDDDNENASGAANQERVTRALVSSGDVDTNVEEENLGDRVENQVLGAATGMKGGTGSGSGLEMVTNGTDAGSGTGTVTGTVDHDVAPELLPSDLTTNHRNLASLQAAAAVKDCEDWFDLVDQIGPNRRRSIQVGALARNNYPDYDAFDPDQFDQTLRATDLVPKRRHSEWGTTPSNGLEIGDVTVLPEHVDFRQLTGSDSGVPVADQEGVQAREAVFTAAAAVTVRTQPPRPSGNGAGVVAPSRRGTLRKDHLGHLVADADELDVFEVVAVGEDDGMDRDHDLNGPRSSVFVQDDAENREKVVQGEQRGNLKQRQLNPQSPAFQPGSKTGGSTSGGTGRDRLALHPDCPICHLRASTAAATATTPHADPPTAVLTASLAEHVLSRHMGSVRRSLVKILRTFLLDHVLRSGVHPPAPDSANDGGGLSADSVVTAPSESPGGTGPGLVLSPGAHPHPHLHPHLGQGLTTTTTTTTRATPDVEASAKERSTVAEIRTENIVHDDHHLKATTTVTAATRKAAAATKTETETKTKTTTTTTSIMEGSHRASEVATAKIMTTKAKVDEDDEDEERHHPVQYSLEVVAGDILAREAAAAVRAMTASRLSNVPATHAHLAKSPYARSAELDRAVEDLLIRSKRLALAKGASEAPKAGDTIITSSTPSAKRRYVSGLREVSKAVRSGRVKLVVIAEDVEDAATNAGFIHLFAETHAWAAGGMADATGTTLLRTPVGGWDAPANRAERGRALAAGAVPVPGFPVVFALGLQRLGRIVQFRPRRDKPPPKTTAIALLDDRGVEDELACVVAVHNSLLLQSAAVVVGDEHRGAGEVDGRWMDRR